jgi:hypothetical protein
VAEVPESLEARSLEARVRRLEDIEAIARLKAAYCAACDDDHNPERVAALFVEGGLWEGRNIGVHARGHAAIRGYIGGVRDSGRVLKSAHMVTNPAITVDGDRATGAWRLLMLYTGADGEGRPVYHRIIGAYEDSFVRVDGTWRFETLRVTVDEAGAYEARGGAL